MRKASDLNDILDAANDLSLDEKETLLDVLRNRTTEERRSRLKREITQARKERAKGKSKSASASQIMREILK